MNLEEKIERINSEVSEASNLSSFLRFKEAYLMSLKTMKFIQDEFESDLKYYRIAVASNISTYLYAMDRYEEACDLGKDVLTEAIQEYGEEHEMVLRLMDNLMRILYEMDEVVDAMELGEKLLLKQTKIYKSKDERISKTNRFLKDCNLIIEAGDEEFNKAPVKEIIGFRYSATGVFGYDYFMDGKMICSVESLVVPEPEVRIVGENYKLQSDFIAVKDIHEGICRHIKEEESGKNAYSLVFHDRRYYSIVSAGKDIFVDIRDGAYLFFRNNLRIGKIKRTDVNDWMPANSEYEYEPYFRFYLYEKAVTTLDVFSMLSFPMLRFI